MSNKPPIVLIGAGGHAASCIDVIEQEGAFTIFGLVGTPEEVGKLLLGYRILGTEEDLPSIRGHCSNALISFGQIKTPALRIRMFEQLQQIGFVMPTVVSPRALVSRHARLGSGTIVMHGAIVNASAVIGQNCIINSRALVEHDAVVGDHCHISTAAVLNGGVQIGSGTFVGSQSCIKQGVRIGANCIIGMSQSVRADCLAGVQIPAVRTKV